MNAIRRCHDADAPLILAVIIAAAEAYRGVIPSDRWHHPYMSAAELQCDIAAGVDFWGCEIEGRLVGVMGAQAKSDVDLIRHAYVLPEFQRHRIGAALLQHLCTQTQRTILVGTWAAATWAVDFYRRNGFHLVSPEHRVTLLKTYWSIPDRQIESSVVLTNASDGAAYCGSKESNSAHSGSHNPSR